MTLQKRIRIEALFSENSDIRQLIATQKETICSTVANTFGYHLEETCFISQIIRREDVMLTQNMLPLEFKIEVSEFVSETAVVHLTEQLIADCKLLASVSFGLWVTTKVDSYFIKHLPQNSVGLSSQESYSEKHPYIFAFLFISSFCPLYNPRKS